MKKFISKHYRKVFEREPKALLEFLDPLAEREEVKRILTGETQDGDHERFLLEAYLSLERAYGPIRSRKILKKILQLIELMWR